MPLEDIDTRLRQQIEFIVEIDKLKAVIRRSYLAGVDRRENSAEHSWHLAVMALVLSEYADEDVDVLRVLKMVLIHDIVEIDAGDSFVYDGDQMMDKEEREQAAAERLFGLLPTDQEQEFRALWEEFEARETPDARFAAALDRLMPLLHSYHTEARSWREHGVTHEQVMWRNSPIQAGSETLWDVAQQVIDTAVEKGYLPMGD